MSEMIVIVRNNVLKRTGGITYFIANNSCYTIRFIFDDIWSAYAVKTAYFIYEDGSAFPVTFEGDVCAVPSLLPGICYIGVSAGEKLSSEPMRVRVCESVQDRIEDEVDEIPSSAYDRIMEILNRILQGGTGGGGGSGGGIAFVPGNALELTEDGTLNVRTTNDAEEDNTFPITSAGVHTIVGNIGAILDTI